MKTMWKSEVIRRGNDTNVGARMIQLTGDAVLSYNIYCEDRYTNAAGTRIAFIRKPHGHPDELWMCDLETLELARADEAIIGMPTTNIYRDSLFYIHVQDQQRTLRRLNLATLERDDVFDLGPCPVCDNSAATISPDERHWLSIYRVRGNIYGFYRVDLARGTWEPFHEHPEICNPHLHFEPSRGEDILVQWNRGCRADEEGRLIRLVGDEGATLYVIDRNGGHERALPVGKPHTSPASGHECWIGNSGRILLTTVEGNTYTVSPGDTRCRLVCRGFFFVHVSVSLDGRFFVADDFANGRIYVGHIASGRLFPLCESGSTCQWGHFFTQPFPYMTPDDKFVIFNSDRTGIGQVWAAEIPTGFLDALADGEPVCS